MSYYDVTPGKIVVGVTGTAETRFTRASFTAKVVTQAKTGPDAKKLAEPVIEKILGAIKSHGEKAKVDRDRLKTGFSVDTYRNRNSGEFAGYEATYTASFTCRNIGEATAIHDALTSIDQVQSPSPQFQVDDSVEVHAQAFADAVARAKARFEAQVSALGFKPEEFFIETWHIRDDHRPVGKTLSLSNGGDEDGIRASIEPGKAILELGVNFVYVRKPKG